MVSRNEGRMCYFLEVIRKQEWLRTLRNVMLRRSSHRFCSHVPGFEDTELNHELTRRIFRL